MRRGLIRCALLCCLSVGSLPAQDANGRGEGGSHFVALRDAARAPAPTQVLVTVSFVETPLDALLEIARQAGLGISYRQNLPQLNRRVSLQAARVPAAEALLSLLRDSGLELFVRASGRTLLLRQKAAPAPQTACAVGGVVREADSTQPLAAADIKLSGSALRTLSSSDGSFCLLRVPAGTYTLEAGLLGYATARIESIAVPSEAAQRVDVLLAAAAITLNDVVVTPGHFGIAHEAINRPETLSREQIETLPQLAEDIFRTVNRLPGIGSNEMSAKFYVRGGDDKSMLVLLDGLELYEPFHLKDFDGALSILDVAAIGGVDLTTGGFSAEYGNRLTGVFDLRTTNQMYARPRTALGLSLSNARIMSQGTFGNGNGLWLLSARRGYVDILLKLIGEDANIKPRYYDVLGKAVYQLSPRHRLAARVLRAGDTGSMVDDDGVGTINSNYGSTYAWLTWQADFSERLGVATQLSTGALSWERRAEEHGTGNDYDVRDIRDLDFLGIKQDWRASISERFALKWGAELRRGRTDYDYYNRIGRERVVGGSGITSYDSTATRLAPQGSEIGLYLAQRVRPWAPLTLETGLRWDRQTYTDEAQFSPRINLALALSGRTTLRAAWGRYAQPHALYQLQVQDGEDTFAGAERAEQIVAGLERDFGNGISARVEAYRRKESDLRPRYRNLGNQIEAVSEVEDDRTRFDPETGRAQGIELFVQRRSARSSWSASYALASARDREDGVELNRPLEQRHTLYVDYSLAPSPAWRLSWSWQYHSGWPVTDATFTADTLGNGNVYINRVFGSYYADRLPAYHRMDVRVTRGFTLKHGRLAVFLDIFNLYNHENPQAYNYSVNYRPGGLRVNRSIEPLLPRLPTLGATWEF